MSLNKDNCDKPISYDELLSLLEENPMRRNVPKLPEGVNSRKNDSCDKDIKPTDRPVDYSLVFGSRNSNPLFGCYNFVLPISDIEEAAMMIDQYLDTTEGVSYEFTYYDCAWTVVHIENNIFGVYCIRIFKEDLSDGKNKYHVYIKRIEGEHYNYMNFFENIRSLFFEIEESPETSIDASVNMDNIFKGFTDYDNEEDGTSIEVRVGNAFNILRNDRISTYEKSDVIKTIVELSTNESAKKFFTSDDLLVLLQYLKSIHNNDYSSLVATRCVIIFYNISLTEKLSQDINDPLLDHLFILASNEGNFFDKELRKKAGQTIVNIVIKYDIISDERKSQLCEWLELTNLLVEKETIKWNLRKIISI